MIQLKTLITEGKSVKIPLGGEKINFKVVPGRDSNVIFMAGSSDDLDKLQDVISFLPVRGVQKELIKYLESKLKVPFNEDGDYAGAGFSFKLDMYSLINKLR